MFRILSTPVICLLVLHDIKFYASFLCVLACLSDFLDGYIARLYGLSSNIGQHLDSFADKLLVSSILIVLMQRGVIYGVHTVTIYMIISRNLLMYFMRNYLNSQRQINLKSNKFGKFTTLMQMLSINLFLFNMENLGLYILWLSMATTIGSFINYYNKVKKIAFN